MTHDDLVAYQHAETEDQVFGGLSDDAGAVLLLGPNLLGR